MSDLIYRDKIIFSPNDVKEEFQLLRKDIELETTILGAFNPGMVKLPNGNILLMIRVAEGLKDWKRDEYILSPRYDIKLRKIVIDKYPQKIVTLKDPRFFEIKQENKTYAIRLIFISWLLPVEISPDADKIVKIHYDKKIIPNEKFQEMGIEDPRITKINNVYYMTVVCVSSNRICTCLYKSNDGISYSFKDIIFEHQNKDIVLFPEKLNGKYYALTRPDGCNTPIGFPIDDKYLAGSFMNIATSLDLIHWKPHEAVVKLLEKQSLYTVRIGPGAPPVIHDYNGKTCFLELFHGVEHSDIDNVGKYRTFAMLLEKKNPEKILAISKEPILQYNKELKNEIFGNLFIENEVVFTTGIVPYNDKYIISSGELDTATRITIVSKDYINSFFN